MFAQQEKERVPVLVSFFQSFSNHVLISWKNNTLVMLPTRYSSFSTIKTSASHVSVALSKGKKAVLIQLIDPLQVSATTRNNL